MLSLDFLLVCFSIGLSLTLTLPSPNGILLLQSTPSPAFPDSNSEQAVVGFGHGLICDHRLVPQKGQVLRVVEGRVRGFPKGRPKVLLPGQVLSCLESVKAIRRSLPWGCVLAPGRGSQLLKSYGNPIISWLAAPPTPNSRRGSSQNPAQFWSTQDAQRCPRE